LPAIGKSKYATTPQVVEIGDVKPVAEINSRINLIG
jgi:hypothetical protein